MDQLGQAEPQPCRLFWNAWQLSDWAITPASLQSKQSKARPHRTDEKPEKSRLVELELGREPLRVLRLQMRPRLRSQAISKRRELVAHWEQRSNVPSIKRLWGFCTRTCFHVHKKKFPKLSWVHLHPEKISNWAPERNSAALTCRTSPAIASAIQSVEIDAVLELKVTVGRESLQESVIASPPNKAEYFFSANQREP
ncbi:hypothetical protein NA56DRAFT_704555 [Hyaloscypha hepaticicola]|uniref:Uncharacterized protein n=1 Tax=Hyaloscypha hepaticicola TaxID=2082293 RepID=A0A2J6Q1S6_9HELO|nr:hypothetical protein NA56DRAFT_704555 [Hyaloscypha hepaticicola]